MASRSSNNEGFAFPLASGLNKKEDKTVKKTIEIYLKNNRLRQGIYQFDLLGEKYMTLVAELQVNWGYSIGILKDKAMGKTPDKDDHAQSRVIAIQIRKVVQTYFANNPKAPQDPDIYARHIYIATAMLVHAIHEVQLDRDRVFAPYLLNEDVEKVYVDGLYMKRRDESSEVLRIRQLEDMLEKSYANDKKRDLEVRALKSKLESFNDKCRLLGAAQASEKAAQQMLDEERDRRALERIEFREYKDLAEKEKSDLYLKVAKFRRRAKLAERELCDLKSQNAS